MIVYFVSALLRDIKFYHYIRNKVDSVECSGPKVNISDTVQDIFCPTVDNVTKVTVNIDGKVAKGLCSLYLSAGESKNICYIVYVYLAFLFFYSFTTCEHDKK